MSRSNEQDQNISQNDELVKVEMDTLLNQIIIQGILQDVFKP